MNEVNRGRTEMTPEEARNVFNDPVSYLAALGVDSEMVGAPAELPSAA